LPKQILTNADLAAKIDTSDEWIVQRTGIRERHVAAEGEFTSHLAINAAKAALADAGIDAGGQFSIGQHFLRQVRTTAQHDRTFGNHEIASCAVCA